MLKISNNGIEISSDRYLTDNASGLFFLLNVIIVIKLNIFPYFTQSFPLSDISLNVLFGFIFFLLSTAIGLIISCFSYALLEFPYIGLEYIWWKLKLPLYPIQFKKEFDAMVGKYDLKYKNWHCKLIIFEEELIKKGVCLDRFLIQRGIRVLLRNISFILLLDFVILFFSNKYDCFCSTILIAIASLLMMSSYIGFFANVGLLFKYKITMTNENLVIED